LTDPALAKPVTLVDDQQHQGTPLLSPPEMLTSGKAPAQQQALKHSATLHQAAVVHP